jgi:hypothetical protein
MSGRESRKRRRRERPAVPPAAAPAEAVEEAKPVRPAKPSKDDMARERLMPLHEDERPTAVTVAAVVAALIAASNLIAWAAGLRVEDHTFNAGEVLPPAILMIVMAAGMWYSRYWAVLGFQTLLVFLLVVMALALVTAQSIVGVAIAVTILAAAGSLFWFLVKALARIQMPERRPRV